MGHSLWALHTHALQLRCSAVKRYPSTTKQARKRKEESAIGRRGSREKERALARERERRACSQSTNIRAHPSPRCAYPCPASVLSLVVNKPQHSCRGRSKANDSVSERARPVPMPLRRHLPRRHQMQARTRSARVKRKTSRPHRVVLVLGPFRRRTVHQGVRAPSGPG